MTMALFARIKVEPMTLRTDPRTHALMHDFLAARQRLVMKAEAGPLVFQN